MSNPVQALAFDPVNRHWLHFQRPVRLFSTTSLSEVEAILSEVELATSHQKMWVVGWVSYEAAPAFDQTLSVRSDDSFPKVWFAAFKKPSILTSLPPTASPSKLTWAPSISEREYLQGAERVRHLIHSGDTYQANYSFRLKSTTPVAALPLFTAMYRAQAGDYSCLIETGDFSILSASPELLFAKSGSSILSKPMKGTAQRGRNLSEDLTIAAALKSCPKNRAENIMIVDMTRNDLSKIAERGSVHVKSLCDVEKYPHLFQMTSTVAATTKASLYSVFKALFPAASITGAPKRETMRIISELETEPRKIYTGSIGVISPNDRAWFNVAIRTSLIDHTQGTTEYGIGSGIVWDSSTPQEYQECLAKAGAIMATTPSFKLFETLLWEPSTGFFLIDEHLRRLANSAAYFSWQVDSASAKNELEKVIAPHMAGDASFRVRIFLANDGSLRVDAAPLTPLPHPYRVSLAKGPINSKNAFLFHKTTDRSVYDQAEPSVADSHDIILWNERGEVTESRIGNICVTLDGKTYTPPQGCGLLAGCYREHLIQRGEITERVITIDELLRAERVFLINSLRKRWDVTIALSQERKGAVGHTYYQGTP